MNSNVLRLTGTLAALTLLFALLGCSKKAEEPTPVAPTPAATTEVPNQGAQPQQQPQQPSAGGGADSMTRSLNDPNVPENVKAKIREQMQGRR